MNLSANYPWGLWLAIPALALLFLFRLLRAKRRRIQAGSLLIWKRLAALPASSKPRRIVFDLSLLLQGAALLSIVAALADVRLNPNNQTGRTLLLVLDNGTFSRARDGAGKPIFESVAEASKALLDRLDAHDRIYVARSAPVPFVLNAAPVNPGGARGLIDGVGPALSGPNASAIWFFATDRARTLESNAATLTGIVSLQSRPGEVPGDGGKNGAAIWIPVIPSERTFGNVAIVEAGSMNVGSKINGGPRVLVRIANFSDQKTEGRVVLESMYALTPKILSEQPLALDAHEERAITFRIAPEYTSALRIVWRSSQNAPDSLPEDDSVVLVPHPDRAPRVRLSSPHPVLEKLLRLATNAEFISSDEPNAAADLDIYIGSVPERLPDTTRAALFIAPERGYRSNFDVGENAIKWPRIQRGDDSPLNAGIAVSAHAAIAIPKAFELLRTGDFSTLVRDAQTGRALAARFVDEKSRPCYVLGFSPGDGLPAERALDPALAAMLVRMTLEAARAGPPYDRVKASEIELEANAPLPLGWRPDVSGNPPTGVGVLDENASNFQIKTSSKSAPNIDAFLNEPHSSATTAFDMTPWFLILGLMLATAEFWICDNN